jgi:uncharacterized protein (TIGR00251 family)
VPICCKSLHLLDQRHMAIILLKVKASAKHNKIEGWLEVENKKYLKISIKEVPEEGKANRAIVKFLAKELDLKQNSLEIISGHTSCYKMLYVDRQLTLADH